jgi:hypothetical protein
MAGLVTFLGVPVAGYANRFIRLNFPEISEEGDPVWVAIKNPKLIVQGDLPKDTENLPNVEDVESEDVAVSEETLTTINRMAARMIVNWHAYDATVYPCPECPGPDCTVCDGNGVLPDQELLPLPVTPESVAKLPMEITMRLGEEMKKINPR